MIQRRVVINLIAFFVMAAALVAYGAFTLLGNPFREPREVRTTFEDASGLLPGFSASLDGVVVGVVDSVELADEGVEVTIDLDEGVTIPSDVEASVIRASAVGEQRVEFTPTGDGTGEPVPDGGEVPAAEDATPPEVSEVLDTANRLITALPADDLNTVIHEAVIALRGREDELAGMAGDIDTFNQEFLAHEEGFRNLLRTSPRLLRAMTEVSPEFRNALADTAVFTGTLAERSQDLTELLQNGAALGEVGAPLLEDTMPNLGCLFSDSAELNDFLADPAVLRNFQLGLDLNQAFFGPIDALAIEGHAIGFPQFGSTERNDQLWLRVQTLIPPGEPHASRYLPIRRTPDTLPGAGCQNAFGTGVGPATQESGGFEPIREDALAPGGDPNVDLAEVPGDDAGGGDADPGAANDPEVLGESEGRPDRAPAPETPEQALDPIRGDGEQSGGSSWVDDLLLAAAIAFFAGATGYLLWSRRRDHGAAAE
ncbi:MAG TPA: MCE family protein [Acidimicrobiales bacterium]|nr:MCE family protein [Acidimicrobiales bacterium]